MKIHILGICGTFMGGLALIARQLGHEVSGSDFNVYPPMSLQLEQQGIELIEGYRAENITDDIDLIIIGNALSRGNSEVEAVLNKNIRYTSGAQWLADDVLQDKWVLAVAGTHGKTTTTSMLAWILEQNGFNPSFLIGGVPLNFGISARLTDSAFFVIEADEYDCAFFDKRSKFVHYRPRTAILNNLEFDHADIFPDLAAIQKQFHHLIRTIPSDGLIISPKQDLNLETVFEQGCWSSKTDTAINANADWNAVLYREDGSEFEIFFKNQSQGILNWQLTGLHNVSNALCAIAAAYHVGILPTHAIEALHHFENVKRRMEIFFKTDNAIFYDDFAHHPTAIATTLDGLRKKVGHQKIIALVEPRSNTMRLGVHANTLSDSLKNADVALVYLPEESAWQLEPKNNLIVCKQLEEMMSFIKDEIKSGGHFVLMSNGSFGNLREQIISKTI